MQRLQVSLQFTVGIGQTIRKIHCVILLLEIISERHFIELLDALTALLSVIQPRRFVTNAYTVSMPITSRGFACDPHSLSVK